MTERRAPEAAALGLLGLAHRAGAVARGTDATRRALRFGEAHLVLTAEDASPVQLEKVLGILGNRAVPRRTLGSRDALGAALGGPPLTAVAVTHEGFAERLLRVLAGAAS